MRNGFHGTVLAMAMVPGMAAGDATLVLMDWEGMERSHRFKVTAGRILHAFKPTRYVVYDPATGTLINVNFKSRTYEVLDRATIEKIRVRTARSARESQAQFKTLSAEEKKLFKAMFPGMLSDDYGVTATAAGQKQIKGHTCRRYVLHQFGQEIGSVCFADYRSMGLSEGEAQAMESMWKTYRELNAVFRGVPFLDPLLAAGVSGVPLELAGSGRRSGRVTLMAITHDSIEPGLFDEYRGLKRMPLNVK